MKKCVKTLKGVKLATISRKGRIKLIDTLGITTNALAETGEE